MEDEQKKTVAGLEEKRKADLAKARERFDALNQQMPELLALKDEEIKDANRALDALEGAVRALSREILGTSDKVLGLRPLEQVNALANEILDCTANALSVLKYLSPSEPLPERLGDVMAMLRNIPVVCDWLRRSACRCGATLALSLLWCITPTSTLPPSRRGSLVLLVHSLPKTLNACWIRRARMLRALSPLRIWTSTRCRSCLRKMLRSLLSSKIL